MSKFKSDMILALRNRGGIGHEVVGAQKAFLFPSTDHAMYCAAIDRVRNPVGIW